MTTNKRLVPVVGVSAAVIVAVVLVLTLATIPFPEFPELAPGRVSGELVFIDQDNCVKVADLSAVEVRELTCEPERSYIDSIAWTDAGVEITFYVNGPTVRVLDPATGEALDTFAVDPTEEPRFVEQGYGTWEDGEMVLRGPAGDEVLRLEAPEAYWVAFLSPGPDDTFAFIDSRERLVVFEAGGSGYLVAENVREYGSVAWAP